MSFTIGQINDAVHVKFTGTVDALDITQMIKDEDYQQELSRLKRVIYDYTEAQSSDLTLEDIRQFATLANVDASFNEHLHVVIVPKDPGNLRNAEFYQQHVIAPSYNVDIAKSLEEACSILAASHHTNHLT